MRWSPPPVSTAVSARVDGFLEVYNTIQVAVIVVERQQGATGHSPHISETESVRRLNGEGHEAST